MREIYEAGHRRPWWAPVLRARRYRHGAPWTPEGRFFHEITNAFYPWWQPLPSRGPR